MAKMNSTKSSYAETALRPMLTGVRLTQAEMMKIAYEVIMNLSLWIDLCRVVQKKFIQGGPMSLTSRRKSSRG